MKEPEILVSHYGGQYAEIIVRLLRESGYRAALIPWQKVAGWVNLRRPKCIILSGGFASVYEEDAPTLERALVDLHVPILGICFGMQVVVHEAGGTVAAAKDEAEFGPEITIALGDSPLFADVPRNITALSSHGDHVTTLPPGFKAIATSWGGTQIEAVENRARRIFGVQFHPETDHTPYGAQILTNFVRNIAHCEMDWRPTNLLGEIQDAMREAVGEGEIIACGFSGGLDSSTITAALTPIFGDRFKSVCINAGQLRHNELPEIQRNAEAVNANLHIVSVEDYFFDEIFGRVKKTAPPYDPKHKRGVFTHGYVTEFEKFIARVGARHFVQGTLAPDRIESGIIKDHHNVGWEIKGCRRHDPLQHLFKYEVRELARSMNLPEGIVNRQPFPGPGLFVRVLEWPTRENIALVRWLDHVTTNVVKDAGDYEKISQLVVGLVPLKMTGVRGDKGAYLRAAIVRPMVTRDFMTATGFYFAGKVWRQIETALVRHPQIGSVCYNGTSKPPATIELE